MRIVAEIVDLVNFSLENSAKHIVVFVALGNRGLIHWGRRNNLPSEFLKVD